MTKFIILFCLIACASAALKDLNDPKLDLFKYDPNDVYSLPEDINDDKDPIVYQGDNMRAKVDKFQNLSGPKKFKLEVQTQNGISVSSVGKLKDDKKTFVVSGSYSFTGADGKRYRTRYTADEFGYHPITEIDLDIPEPQPIVAAAPSRLNSLGAFGGLKNRFQFLNQNLEGDQNGERISGDDYSFSNLDAAPSNNHDGYNYAAPAKPLETPSRYYLPV